jgi:hypothetical protein
VSAGERRFAALAAIKRFFEHSEVPDVSVTWANLVSTSVEGPKGWWPRSKDESGYQDLLL